ncbi:MAG: tetratricopeptide repeat-containing glycosyltransferase family protein [Rhodospirillaceae bacterium]
MSNNPNSFQSPLLCQTAPPDQWASAVSHARLGLMLASTERPFEAMPHLVRSIEMVCRTQGALDSVLREDIFPAFDKLVTLVTRKEQLEYAEFLGWQFLEKFPSDHAPYAQLARILYYRRHLGAALHLFRHAPPVCNRSATFLSYTAASLSHLGRGYAEEALRLFQEALELDPRCADLRLTYGDALQCCGDFPRAWQEYEKALPLPELPISEWRGENLVGKSIVIGVDDRYYCGYGDVIQLARYIPLLQAGGGSVTFVVPGELQTLIAESFAGATVVPKGTPLPKPDFHSPLFALPRVMKTTVDTVPSTVPYLRASPEQRTAWRHRLRHLTGRRIGIVWSGILHVNDYGFGITDHRHVALSRLEEVLATPGADFISLQMGEPRKELKRLPAGQIVHDFMSEVADFSDTAALLDCLDLVISIDTATAHLAGACGKPVWILLPYGNCGRWLYDREDTPWYPTARLLRQKAPGAWSELVERLQGELATG